MKTHLPVRALRYPLLLAALLAAGCTNTITKTETVILQCSATAPTGACGVGESCFVGACVPTATLCAPTNLTGTCGSGTTCFGGGCVLQASLCNTANPIGPCITGQTCVEGTCFATSSLCSAANPTGMCPAGKTCTEGSCVVPGMDPCKVAIYSVQPVIGVDTRAKLTVDGKEFKDSNGNGTLEPYEDWRLSEICRAKNLVTLMTVPQKVGLMSESSWFGSGTADGSVPQGVKDYIEKSHVRQALMRLGSRSAQELATYLNNLQKLAEAQPLSIPIAITADPVHGFGLSTNATTGAQTLGASSIVTPWPYPMGLGAINDLAVTRQYGDTVRKEFMAMGFRWQLGPMADLATEPRWARVQNTFGENAFMVANHVRACIEGFQNKTGGGLKNGIAATMKHFPGAGSDQDGMDSHSRPGRYNVYPGNNFLYHSIPFQAAVDTGVAAVMPCYSIFRDQFEYNPEQTGAFYSKGLITRYLKATLGFTGMVTADWGVLSGTAWGVEGLSPQERVAMFLRAGSHQLGLDSFTNVQLAYDQGFITEAEINGAAEKILEMTFKLGLFENPYVDAAAAASIVRSPEHRLAGLVAQKKAIVILKNRDHSATGSSGTKYLPIDGLRAAGDRIACDTNNNGTVEVYFDGVTDGLAGSDIYDDALQSYEYASAAGGGALAVVNAATPATADIAVVRITARKGVYFGLDDGVPLSFDGPFKGKSNDSTVASAIKDRNRVIDLFRIRDGYTNAAGVAIAPVNPNLKIVLVMHMDRPGIARPFISGLTTLNETLGVPGSYPLVSNRENIRADGLGGVDAFLVEFGAYDRAVLDVVFNKNVPTAPTGYVYGSARLPIEIPGYDEEVDAQFEDLPNDTPNPTYALGSGSTY